MKRIFSFTLILILILSGCGKKNTDAEAGAHPVYLPDSTVHEISLHTDGKAQPFLAESYDDKHIVSLVFDSLFAIDNDYSLKPLLADSYYLNENVLTITLKNGLKFSDGSEFDASALADALAAVRGEKYAPLTEALIQTDIVSPYCIQLTLSAVPDNLIPTLTFPVVSSSGHGIGAYIYADEKTLVPNENYYGGKATLSKINLVSGDKVSLFNNGQITFLYNDGTVSPGDIGKSDPVRSLSTNKLTFLGLNRQKKLFSRSEYRNALSALTDRTYLASFSAQGNGYVSFSVINPVWYKYDHSVSTVRYSDGEAKELLSAIMKNAPIKIIANSENINRVMIARSLADTLEALGAKVTVSALAWDDYISAVSNSNYDIYVGETLLSENMDISAFLPDYADISNVQEIISVLSEDMPVIPIFFDQHTLLSNGTSLSENEPYLAVVGYK